jgi:hypothetical protein
MIPAIETIRKYGFSRRGDCSTYFEKEISKGVLITGDYENNEYYLTLSFKSDPATPPAVLKFYNDLNSEMNDSDIPDIVKGANRRSKEMLGIPQDVLMGPEHFGFHFSCSSIISVDTDFEKAYKDLQKAAEALGVEI